MNAYAYVGGNPLSYVDPLGTQEELPDAFRYRRPKDSVHCKELRDKIGRIRKDIFGKRFTDLIASPGKLPYRIGPGEDPSETVRGHEALIDKELNRLKFWEDRYWNECDDDDWPPQEPQFCPSPDAESSSELGRDWSGFFTAAGIGGVIVGGTACALAPEACIPGLIITSTAGASAM